MGTHPYVEVVRAGFEAFARGDLTTLNEIIADDVLWHQPGRNSIAGDYHGKQELLALFSRMYEETGGSFHQEPKGIFADDSHVVAFVHTTAERQGRTLDQDFVQLFHVADGKMIERWLLADDDAAHDAFWA